MLSIARRMIAAATLVLAAAQPTAPAVAGVTEADRPAIETMVRDYLLAHPDVLEDAMKELSVRREADAAEQRTKALADRRDDLFNSRNQMVIGNPLGKVTLVQFFDYNCGYCKRAVSDVTALIAANPDLRVVMKEFPILSPGSVEAARVSVAVKDLAPAKYDEFHNALFARPGEAGSAKALGVVADLGLDRKAIQVAANRDDVTMNLQEVNGLAEALGITGTPSYVIGGEILPGAVGYDALQAIVASVRTCGKAVCS